MPIYYNFQLKCSHTLQDKFTVLSSEKPCKNLKIANYFYYVLFFRTKDTQRELNKTQFKQFSRYKKIVRNVYLTQTQSSFLFSNKRFKIWWEDRHKKRVSKLENSRTMKRQVGQNYEVLHQSVNRVH